MSTKKATPANDGNGFDEYEVYCKLRAMAVLIGNIHSKDSWLTVNECYGIELLLQEIADLIDPSQQAKGGAE